MEVVAQPRSGAASQNLFGSVAQDGGGEASSSGGGSGADWLRQMAEEYNPLAVPLLAPWRKDVAARWGEGVVEAAHDLPPPPQGPAVWQVADAAALQGAVEALLADPRQCAARGYASCQAASAISQRLVSTLTRVLDAMVLQPALQPLL